MSALYACDLYASVLADANILNVLDLATPASGPLAGNFMVKVPDWVAVDAPANLGALLTQKYTGLLAYYSNFTYIAYDDLLDPSGVDLTGPSTAGLFGSRSNIKLFPGGVLQSLPVTLSGSAPTQALVTFETFTVSQTDIVDGKVTRTFTEVEADASGVTCSVSFNGGSNWISTTDGSVLNVLLADRGTSFLIQLTNGSAGAVNLGGWALLYV